MLEYGSLTNIQALGGFFMSKKKWILVCKPSDCFRTNVQTTSYVWKNEKHIGGIGRNLRCIVSNKYFELVYIVFLADCSFLL